MDMVMDRRHAITYGGHAIVSRGTRNERAVYTAIGSYTGDDKSVYTEATQG